MRKVFSIWLAVVVLAQVACSANASLDSHPSKKENSGLLVWERIGTQRYEYAGYVEVDRVRVPGGWIVRSTASSFLAQTFVSDSGHTWVLSDSTK